MILALIELASMVSRGTAWIQLLLFTSSCNFSDFSGERAQAKTVCPFADNCLTNSRPRPREAPVTTNVRDMYDSKLMNVTRNLKYEVFLTLAGKPRTSGRLRNYTVSCFQDDLDEISSRNKKCEHQTHTDIPFVYQSSCVTKLPKLIY